MAEDVQSAPGNQKPYWIPRRRVKAIIRLVDENSIEGELYASVEGTGGSPALLVDRLNHPSEKFVPVAVGGRHILLNKTNITTLEIPGGRYEFDNPNNDVAREIQVRIWLSEQTSVTGSFFTCLPEPHSRALDYLNLRWGRFFALSCNGSALLVNMDRIQHVTETRHQN